MWFGRNTKSIKLSRNLNWGIGKGHRTGRYFWIVGSACILAAIFFTFQTSQEPTPAVLGLTSTQPAATPEIKLLQYKVSQGESLFSISNKFSIPLETLAQLNDLRSPFIIKSGDTLKIPEK